MAGTAVLSTIKSGFYSLHHSLMRGSFVNPPLIHPQKKLCLFFSQKSGCTFATNWFFDQLGILEDARNYSTWVHHYRFDVYYKKQEYLQLITRVLGDEYKRVKLVRSPYSRAVSSFIHAVKSNYLKDELSEFLDRPVDREHGFTFSEWVHFIDTTGVRKCNPHHRQQTERREENGTLDFHAIIRLENSYDEFRRLEQEYGLKASDLDVLSKSEHHRNREPEEGFCGDRMHTQLDNTFNEYHAYYDDALKHMVAEIYHRDFSNYGYSVDKL